MASEADQIYYKLPDLAALLGVETSVLRFWEKEFGAAVKPLKVGPRKKLYRPRDLEIFREIKRLLQEDRYTIPGARRRLETADAPAVKDETVAEGELKALRSALYETKRELLDLRNLLAPDAASRPRRAKTSKRRS